MMPATLAGAGIVLSALAFAPQARAAEPAKPNILFILADNLGYGELGAYGGGATRGAQDALTGRALVAYLGDREHEVSGIPAE